MTRPRPNEALRELEIRPAHTDADLEAWIRVRRAVLPDESAGTVESLRAQESEERVLFLAEWQGELAGSGLADRSDMRMRFGVAPRVLPEFRRRGIGTALLREAGGASSIVFQATGMGAGQSRINICRATPSANQSRAVSISATGRTNVTKSNDGSCASS